MMKRIRIIFGLIVMCLLFGSMDTFASTKVNIRTAQDYLVPDDVIVTESIKSAILGTPAIDAGEKIYDFAELFTDSEEEKLYKKMKKFIDETSLDYAIVTINKNDKNSAMNYAHDFYDYNDFLDSGLLFLIDMDTRTIYMVTKGSAVSKFPDSRMEPILKNVYNKISEKKYYDACNAFTTSIAEFVNIEVGDDDVVINEDGTLRKDWHLLEVLLFALVGTVVIIVIMVFSCKTVHEATSSKEFLNKETMKIVHISEMFLGSHTSKVRIDKSSSSSSGSRGGSAGRSGGAGIKF